MIIYGNELAASFKQKMKAEIEILKKETTSFAGGNFGWKQPGKPVLCAVQRKSLSIHRNGEQDDRAARRYFTAGIRECRAAAK